MKVMDFVFYDNEDLRESFKQVWKDYSTRLHEATKENLVTLVLKKNIAEDYLYKGICRAERMLIKELNNIIDLDISKHKASISEYDIFSIYKAIQLVIIYESFVNRVNGDISDKAKKMRSGYAAVFMIRKKKMEKYGIKIV